MVQYFSFSEDVLEVVAEQLNLYAIQCDTNALHNLTTKGLETSWDHHHHHHLLLDDREPELGDLIQIFRDNYQHWAVYVGDGFVVHFVEDSGGSISTSVTAGNGFVLKQKLWNVVGKDKWKVNNSLDKEYKPHPANVIVKKAKAVTDKQLEYNLLSYNCEHFVNELRYGVAESQQVQKAVEVATVVGVVGGAALLGILASRSKESRSRPNSY
ncbi:phospholipase A and acyltransferase 3-like isoform X2 [Archocentrus centrarchus]|uniref:phospholipase A and acyltransferase 3-like isoform X2 n=1 Tax=Archocentrus centrarchus TaxID=63155 RepID=UPI0011E9C1E1|nr:phospholipase A and acyltransferase 3-like isoform X2 [Archocentrus centrarchus]